MINPRIAAKLLGGDMSGRDIVAPGPNHSRGDRSLQVTLDPRAPEGFIVHSHAGDDWRACRDHVRDRLGLPRFASDSKPAPSLRTDANTAPSLRIDKNTASLSAFARDIWNAAVDPRDTLAEHYIEGRGLHLDGDLAMRCLRYHPRCPFGRGVSVPALIAAFRPIRNAPKLNYRPAGNYDRDDQPPPAIHRIGLNRDGTKIAKMMLGPVTGCAVKLDPDDMVEEGLGIAEGVETAMAVRATGWHPVWALGSASTIRTFEPIPGIEALTIFADNDGNATGIEAARHCAERWAAAGCEVFIRTPRAAGADWLDVQP